MANNAAEKLSTADLAIQLVDTECVLGVDQNRQSCAIIEHEHAKFILPISSADFESMVRETYFQNMGKSLRPTDVKQVVDHFATKAKFSGASYVVNRRYSFDSKKNEFFIDKCDDDYTVMCLKNGKVSFMTQAAAPVHFKYDENMKPSPNYFANKGDWQLIKKYINLANEQMYPLLLAQIGQMMVRMGPYVMACFVGQAGSGKSEAASFILSLVDPSNNPMQASVGNEKDIAIAVQNSVVLGFDNIEPFSKFESNILCRLLTGNGLRTRKLFSDSAEIILFACSPVIVTSIDQPIRTDDLMDRSITYTFSRIPENRRMAKQELLASLEVDKHLIFSAILDMVASALSNFNSLQIESLPRMADFAKFACACAPYFGLTAQQMLDLYASSQQEMVADVADDSPFIRAVHRLVSRKQEAWQGNATELLKELEFAPEVVQKGWPQSSIAAGKLLTRYSEVLNKLGIDVEKIERHRRQLRLSKLPHFQPAEEIETPKPNIRRTIGK
ncbi:MAG: hypothetical protein K2W88_09050 [Pararheinheimera sp.]|jgi:hypothetical protein|nr:hypothetical protein [Rheinheimera sp.]